MCSIKTPVNKKLQRSPGAKEKRVCMESLRQIPSNDAQGQATLL